jgi:hypothetical protein
MITVTLTSVTGTTRQMEFPTKENILLFIEQYADILPIGRAVNIDAPLAGIHSGWIQGRAAKV